MRLASIHVYPVKGARGISLARGQVLRGGLRHDRRFMLDGEGVGFLTQRSHPALARVETALTDRGTLLVGRELELSLDDADYRGMPRRRVRVWDDDVEATEVPGAAAAFFSELLGLRCALVRMPDDAIRPVERPYGRDGDRVGFADAYPLLVASLASLADLNARLAAIGEAEVPMDRFRPSLVFDGGAPYEEERHPGAEIGALRVRLPKRCARCQVTTVDQRTGDVSKEPLRTLASYRREGNYVYFAMNAIPDAEAVVAVGDRVAFTSGS